MAHQLLEEKVGGRGQAHGRARVAVADLLDGVRGQNTGCVHGALVRGSPVKCR